MNQQEYNEAMSAYQSGDFARAAAALNRAKQPGEVSGKIDHLLGNCYMQLSNFEEAAKRYADALADSNYQHKGALACNRGRALLAANKPQDAIASLTMSLKDKSYPTPYKAQVALGDAYMALSDARNAGVAYRSAAIDESNPVPAQALTKLGSCFMGLGRADDAIEAYRTALDFATPLEDPHHIYEKIGLAYFAANRLTEARDAFMRAEADSTYTLSPEASAAAEATRKALAAKKNGGPSQTDALLAAAGYGSAANVDPLDPLGKSGELMPSPEDTGFFSVSEEDLVSQGKQDKKANKKHRHTGLKIFIVILILILLAAAALLVAYYKGYGWPTQESVVEDLFVSASNNRDVSHLLTGTLSADARNTLEGNLPSGVSEVNIKGVDRSLSESSVLAELVLTNGGKQPYLIDLVRDGIGWKVSNVELNFDSLDRDEAVLEDAPSSLSADNSAETDASEEDISASSADDTSSDTSNSADSSDSTNE